MNKYDWFKAIYAEREFTGAERAVLGYIAVVYIKDSPTFCVKQSIIAERCGVSEVTANTTIRKAKRLGYLVLSGKRKRGAGCDRANELTLVLPAELDKEIEVNSTESDTKQTAESWTKQTGELDKENTESWTKQTGELDKVANAVTCENETPRGVFRGDQRGDLRGVGATSRATPDEEAHLPEDPGPEDSPSEPEEPPTDRHPTPQTDNPGPEEEMQPHNHNQAELFDTTPTGHPADIVVVNDHQAATTNGSRGHRLPGGWMPPQNTIAEMKRRFPVLDFHREHEKFTNHWLSSTGRNATKRDWDRAWRNWILTAADRHPTGGQHGLNTVDQKALGWQEMARRMGGDQ